MGKRLLVRLSLALCILCLALGATTALAAPVSKAAADAPAEDAAARAEPPSRDRTQQEVPVGPTPPKGWPADAQSTTGPTPPAGVDRGILDVRAQNTLSVPAYLWTHGCGPTAAGMVLGYWDAHGFPELVSGDASTQTAAVNAMIASSQHYDDYSLPLDYYPAQIQLDKSEPPAGDEHASNSVADFMGTSWSALENYYGWSWFGDVDDSLRDYVQFVTPQYTVTTQSMYWGAFTWTVLRTEIDAGRPLVVLVDTDADGSTDHFVTVIGYSDNSGTQMYAVRDTWDTSVHWYQFRGVASGVSWGIYGAVLFQISSQTPGTISGTVYNRDGAIIPGAAIEAVRGSSYYNTYANENGVYTLTGLPAASDYRVYAWATGYTMEYYNNVSTWSGATLVSVNAGQTTSNINFWLDPVEWTFLVYLDGDNNLEEYAIDDFLEMAAVGSNPKVNIVVQMDRISGYDSDYGDWTDTRRFYIYNGIQPNASSALASLGEVNMGDPQTLIDFVQWGMANYPAQKYALVLWDHGSGWRTAKNVPQFKAVAYDESSGNDSIQAPELRSAMAAITNNGARPIDLVGFDACMMAMTEVDNQLLSYANVRVGAEETEPGPGWPYTGILSQLTANSAMTPATLGTVIVNQYYASWGNDETQSAVNLNSAYVNLNTAVNNLASALINDGGVHANDIVKARSFTQSFNDPTFVDLYDFAYRLNLYITDAAINSAATAVMNAVNGVVIRERHGTSWPGAHGISIYYPASSTAIDPLYDGSAGWLQFTANTLWDEWLHVSDNVPPPANDAFASALRVNSWPYTYQQATVTATSAGDDPEVTYGTCGDYFSGQGYHSVWYKYVASANGTLNVNTFTSTYDTVLAVWVGGPGTWVMQVCNDDTNGLQSSVSLSVAANSTYYIEVMSWSSTAGGLNLSADGTAAPFVFDPPALVEPTGTIFTNLPTYRWTEVPTATWYRLWTEDASTHGVLVDKWYKLADLTCAGGTCAVAPGVYHRRGTYNWKVQSWANAGYGEWGGPASFIVDAGLTAATLVSPTGTVGVAKPTFTWNEAPAATWYQLVVTGPTNVSKWYASSVCTGGLCTVPSPSALTNGVYTWKIQTWNKPEGYGPWSATLDFTVNVPVLIAPTPLEPNAGTVIASTTPTYSWTETAGAEWYQLWVGKADNTQVLSQWYQVGAAGLTCGSGTCQATPTTVLHGGDFKWTVRAWNTPQGNGPWSAEMPFRFGKAAPIAPNPGAPVDEPTPVYSWQQAPLSTWYQLWVKGPAGKVYSGWFESTAALCPGGVCSAQPAAPLTAGAYEWWVQTYIGGGSGPWSDGLAFTITYGKPALIAPLGVVNTAMPAFIWTEEAGATWYQLWVGNAAVQKLYATWYQVGAADIACGGGQCQVTPAPELAEGAYTWYVQSYFTSGYKPWSDRGDFTVDLP